MFWTNWIFSKENAIKKWPIILLSYFSFWINKIWKKVRKDYKIWKRSQIRKLNSSRHKNNQPSPNADENWKILNSKHSAKLAKTETHGITKNRRRGDQFIAPQRTTLTQNPAGPKGFYESALSRFTRFAAFLRCARERLIIARAESAPFVRSAPRPLRRTGLFNEHHISRERASLDPRGQYGDQRVGPREAQGSRAAP